MATPIIICFIPFIAMFLLIAILIPGISVGKEFIATIAGLISLIPIVLIQMLIPGMRLFNQVTVLGIFFYALLFCGVIEECLKAVMLYIVPSKFEKLQHFFAYAILAGMILGSFESVIYVIQGLNEIKRGNVYSTTLSLIYLRMFTSLLIHTFCAGLSGLTIYSIKNGVPRFSGIVKAVVIHGVYNFFVSFDNPVKYFSIAAILLAIMECRVLYVRIREDLREKESIKVPMPKKPENLTMPPKPVVVPEESVVETVEDAPEEDFEKVAEEATLAMEIEKKSAKKASPKKTAKAPVKKSAEKKPAAKTTKTSAKKSVSKKPAAEKTVAKAPAKKAATKTESKAPAKKVAAKKPVEKKAASKTAKTSSAKTVAVKAPAKKTAAKKTAAKTETKAKPVAKKAAGTKKK